MKIRMAVSLLACSIVMALVPATLCAQQAEQIPGASVYRDLKYGNGPGASNMLDLYVPASRPATPLPLIVWIHGGAWEEGDKSRPIGSAALRYGYAVASINYRLSQQAQWPAQIQDCRAAVRWLRANAARYNIDPNRIGAWGESAGGHLAALLGTSGADEKKEWDKGENLNVSSGVQAVCDWFGPTDLVRLWDEAKARGNWDKQNNPLTRLFGGQVPEKSQLAATANPIAYISKNDPPFLILHGDRDDLVPLSQSKLLHDALKDAGVQTELVVVKGNGHGGGGFLNDKNGAKILAFFDKYVKNAPHPKNTKD